MTGRASTSLRTLFLSLVLTSMTGCGFHPIYGHSTSETTDVREELNDIAIDNIPDRAGQMLRNNLMDRMYGRGRPSQPLYRLSIKLKSNESDVGVLSNATSTLAELDTYADYTLTDSKGKTILKGNAHSESSFSRLNDQYATVAAHDDAVERTVHEVSEQIVNRISLYFSSPHDEASDKKPDTAP